MVSNFEREFDEVMKSQIDQALFATSPFLIIARDRRERGNPFRFDMGGPWGFFFAARGHGKADKQYHQKRGAVEKCRSLHCIVLFHDKQYSNYECLVK